MVCRIPLLPALSALVLANCSVISLTEGLAFLRLMICAIATVEYSFVSALLANRINYVRMQKSHRRLLTAHQQTPRHTKESVVQG